MAEGGWGDFSKGEHSALQQFRGVFLFMVSFVGVAIVGVLVTWVVKLLSRLLIVIDGSIAISDAGHLKRTFKELFPSICFLV